MSATLSESLREILKSFSDDGEKRRTLLDVAEFYTPNAYVDRVRYSQYAPTHKKIRVYLLHDVVVAVLLRSAI